MLRGFPSADFFPKPNNLDPDQARRFVGPDLGPNWSQSLSVQ